MSERPNIWRFRGLILVLGVAAYWPALRAGFIWDDRFLIVENTRLSSWSEAPSDFTRPIFPDPTNTFYRPLLPFSLRFDRALFGLHPFGYHLTNLLLHLGNSLLVLELVLCLGISPLAALLTGALFSVHPIIVQNLLMVVGRDELLSLFLGLSSVLMLLHPGGTSVAVGLMLFMGSLLAKESGVSTFVFFVCVAWGRLSSAVFWRRTAALIMVTFVYAIVHHSIVPQTLPPFDPVWLSSFLIMGVPYVLWRYAALIAWPWPLYTDRMVPTPGAAWPLFTLSLAALTGWLLWKRSRIGVICLVWFMAGLAPKLIKTLTTRMTLDHWAYASLPGALLPLGLLLAHGWSHPREGIRRLTRASFGLILVFWVTVAHLNIRLRGTEESFYGWSARFPTSPTILRNYAAILIHQGRYREAAALVERLKSERP